MFLIKSMATALFAPLTPASSSTVTDVSLGYQQGSASSAGKIRCCEDTTDVSGVTAAPVSIDPYVVASRHETVFEGSQVKGARRRRCRDAQGGGREDLLCVDAHHKALDKEASRDRGRGARADPRQALQERSDA